MPQVEHGKYDRKRYDCNDWCISKGHAAGECKKTADGVCGTKASAYCKCTGPTKLVIPSNRFRQARVGLLLALIAALLQQPGVLAGDSIATTIK